MKKAIDGFILIVLCIFLFTGCYKKTEAIPFEEIANASKIEVLHYLNGAQTEKTIENNDDINEAANWFNSLLLDEVVPPEELEEVEIETEIESYHFQAEKEGIYFMNADYIIYDQQYYIHYQKKWYIVRNPVSITFLD